MILKKSCYTLSFSMDTTTSDQGNLPRWQAMAGKPESKVHQGLPRPDEEQMLEGVKVITDSSANEPIIGIPFLLLWVFFFSPLLFNLNSGTINSQMYAYFYKQLSFHKTSFQGVIYIHTKCYSQFEGLIFKHNVVHRRYICRRLSSYRNNCSCKLKCMTLSYGI